MSFTIPSIYVVDSVRISHLTVRYCVVKFNLEYSLLSLRVDLCFGGYLLISLLSDEVAIADKRDSTVHMYCEVKKLYVTHTRQVLTPLIILI